MDEIILRRAHPTDADRLSRLARETFCETFVTGFKVPYPAEDLIAFLDAAYSPSVFSAKIEDCAQAVWIAEVGSRPLAYACAGPCTLPHPDADPSHRELSRLYVRREAQGSGLGKRVMDEALAWMVEHSAGPVWLGVWSGNIKAQRFYQGYGFREVGRYIFPVGDWEDLDLVYRRDRDD